MRAHGSDAVTPAKAARLIVKLEEAETAMLRAINKWTKLRQQVRRADRTLAKEAAHVQAQGAKPGELHPGDLHPHGRGHLDAHLDRLR